MARGYKFAQLKKNTVLFSTTRTKAREKLFKWVGPITSTVISLIAKQGGARTVASAKDLEGYTIGTVRDDVRELLLREMGVEWKNIYRTDDPQTAAKMLIGGRVDLWAYDRS